MLHWKANRYYSIIFSGKQEHFSCPILLDNNPESNPLSWGSWVIESGIMKETEMAPIMFMLIVDSYYVHEEDLGQSEVFSYHWGAGKNFENKIQYWVSKCILFLFILNPSSDSSSPSQNYLARKKKPLWLYISLVSIWRNYFNHICFFIFYCDGKICDFPEWLCSSHIVCCCFHLTNIKFCYKKYNIQIPFFN